MDGWGCSLCRRRPGVPAPWPFWLLSVSLLNKYRPITFILIFHLSYFILQIYEAEIFFTTYIIVIQNKLQSTSLLATSYETCPCIALETPHLSGLIETHQTNAEYTRYCKHLSCRSLTSLSPLLREGKQTLPKSF